MRLTQIRDFLAVVEAGSIRAAARNLGVSQPAVTKSMRSLETELQVQLMQRTPHGIAPTRAGRAFLIRARVAHTELSKAVQEATQQDGEGTVAIGCGPVASVLLMPEAIASFGREFPRVRVRIIEGWTPNLLPMVRNETIEFALGPRPPNLDRAFRFRPLYRAEHLVVARKGHALAKSRSLADLVDADWLDLMQIGQVGAPLSRMFAASGLSAPRQVHCDSFNTIVAMVTKTDMLATFPAWLLEEPFVRDLLVPIRIAEPMPTLNVGMFTRADSPLTPTAAAMAKEVIAVGRRLAQRR